MIKTYFQNRITGAEFASLVEKRESFVLESVGDLDGAVDICTTTVASLGMIWRIDDNRPIWQDDVSSFMPGPLHLIYVLWRVGKDLLHRGLALNPDVVIVERPQSLYVRFRSSPAPATRNQSSVG
ncbi:hypothetical protein [Bordetella sp. N]|uniref:hypothetical protein n=1 Tax=Bordetella sp. N TaxID=1746199 RepID=UPI00070C3733|nr:hypothetical protein [Bordetella sp. N]ALM83641.1 hypothetical protein ASB57_12265 [Bordetella sp. N]